MFTGIVEEIGHIVSVQRHAFSQIITISASDILGGTNIGDSIAVNGVCLTVTSIGSKQFSADVMHETINKSSLGNLRAGMAVNLERAMPANGRFGGHIVSGHIDGVGRITKISIHPLFQGLCLDLGLFAVRLRRAVADRVHGHFQSGGHADPDAVPQDPYRPGGCFRPADHHDQRSGGGRGLLWPCHGRADRSVPPCITDASNRALLPGECPVFFAAQTFANNVNTT